MVHKYSNFNAVVTLQRSGRPTKIPPRAMRVILQEVTKNPRVTSEDLQNVYLNTNSGALNILLCYASVATMLLCALPFYHSRVYVFMYRPLLHWLMSMVMSPPSDKH